MKNSLFCNIPSFLAACLVVCACESDHSALDDTAADVDTIHYDCGSDSGTSGCTDDSEWTTSPLFRSAADVPQMLPSLMEGLSGSNIPPISNAGPDQNVIEWVTVTLNGTGSSDPDSGPGAMTYSWTQTGGTIVTLTGANTASPTFYTPILVTEETLTFALQVCDTDECDVDNVAINVDYRQTVSPDFLEGFEDMTFSESWVTWGSAATARSQIITSYSVFR